MKDCARKSNEMKRIFFCRIGHLGKLEMTFKKDTHLHNYKGLYKSVSVLSYHQGK